MDLDEISTRVRRMVRAGKVYVTDHVTKAHPERDIKKDDVIEVLKIGRATEHDPLLVGGKPQFSGRGDRFVWVGEDQKERVLKLKITIEQNIVVVHGEIASLEEEAEYRKEND